MLAKAFALSERQTESERFCACERVRESSVCVCVFACAHVWLFLGLLQTEYKNTHSASTLLAGPRNFKRLSEG